MRSLSSPYSIPQSSSMVKWRQVKIANRPICAGGRLPPVLRLALCFIGLLGLLGRFWNPIFNCFLEAFFPFFGPF
jgi:hypothetical protein